MQEYTVQTLLTTPIVTLHDVACRGTCRHRSAEECATATHLVFPYRGVYVRHVGSEDSVAEANQVLFFNAGEEYRVSHPVEGGDASLSLAISEPVLHELMPKDLARVGETARFRKQRQRIDPRAQALVALLRHSLRHDVAETLEAETLSLTLARRSLGVRAVPETSASHGRRRLVDRMKLTLTGDLSRRWTLADIAAEVGGSPVYLTQAFQQVEGVPLYRYQLQLRLARALDLIEQYDDLSALGQHLGFSSHSHFSSAFRQAYGRTPSQFKQSALQRAESR